ncbi:DUF6892 domain-containing protein [Massilia antarctica]|uniref:DUF6892 domain-containing protein n=1 Tax=Massilia antarctica TaxID=2765360 RepID=UPI002272047B|nr:hypothetical protein [Massilia sp. H27-R4]MCY0914460.1 hypothetical protein [Massilia sp. H27-R4]
MTLVRELTPTHDKYSHVIKAVNRAWMAFADQSDAAADELYRYVTECLGQADWMHEREAQAAYQLLYAFHANHLRFPGANEHLRHGLRQQSSSILSLILYLVPYSTQTLFKVPVKPHNGVGADAIGMLLDMYSYHTGLCKDDDLRADAAHMLPLLVRANPQIGDGLTLCLLRGHPERADIICQLIELYLDVSERERMFGMFYHTMRELLDNDGGSFVYEELDKITARLAVSSATWTSDRLDTFAEHAFFYRLRNDDDRRLLLSKSAKARRLARMIIDSGHSATHIDTLRSLYHALGDAKPVAPQLESARQFEDLNFKLLVIQKLMYDQETLLPRFDVEEFIREYTGREIMIKEEGYDVIPEVLRYFEALVIPPQLLAQVEELSFDPSAAIYCQVFPCWDGECDTFDVASVRDIGLLPNLKRMSYMPDRFVERHATTLRQRGIEIG